MYFTLVAALLSSTLALPTEDSAAAEKHVHRHAAQHARAKQQHGRAAEPHRARWGPIGYGYSNGANEYQRRVLDHHNYHRANHLAVPLQWDPALAYSAQQVAQTCIYGHNMQFDPNAGQNIAAGYGPEEIGTIITDLFYNHELPMFQNQWYTEPDMTYFEKWGHMTQMCWKDTTHVGCATQYCPSGLANVGSGVQPYFTVCNYKNPGNVATEYAQNLSPPQGAAPITGHSF